MLMVLPAGAVVGVSPGIPVAVGAGVLSGCVGVAVGCCPPMTVYVPTEAGIVKISTAGVPLKTRFSWLLLEKVSLTASVVARWPVNLIFATVIASLLVDIEPLSMLPAMIMRPLPPPIVTVLSELLYDQVVPLILRMPVTAASIGDSPE